MPTDAFAHFVFVDFENVPKLDLGLVAGKSVHVTILIGKNQKPKDFDFTEQIHRYADQVTLIRTGATGHNALDLILGFYLGQAIQRTPDAQFYIVSQDKGYEPLLGHLRDNKKKVVRCDSFEVLPLFATPRKPAIVATKQPVDRRSEVIARLMNPAATDRPTTRRKLLAKIKTDLGKENSEAKVADVYRELTERLGVTIDDKDKVHYSG